ncbi:MAG: sarcosine oxidase, partial [Myxococcota bacterium]
PIKVGIDWCPEENRGTSPLELRKDPAPHVVAHLEHFMRTRLKHVEERLELRLSPYTMTPDVNFILDRLHPRLTCFAGGSGQAFKFCPLIGELLGALSLGDSINEDIAPWRADRFSTVHQAVS